MFQALVLSLALFITTAERPSDMEPTADKMEFAAHGHFVSSRHDGGKRHRHEGSGDLTLEEAEDKPVQGQEGSFVELQSNATANESVSSEQKADERGLLNRRDSSSADALKKPGYKNDKGGCQGNVGFGCRCSQRTEVQGCQSLCYRVWLTPFKSSDCGDFTRDMETIGNYANPDARGDAMSKKMFGQRDHEWVMDTFYQDMKTNIQENEMVPMMQSLKQLANEYPKVRNQFDRPLSAALNAFELREAYDQAAEALKRGKDVEADLQKLDKAIEKVKAGHTYGQMSNHGLSICGNLATKLNIISKLQKATSDGEAVSSSNGKEVDAALKALFQYRKMARDDPDRAYITTLREADRVFNKIYERMSVEFKQQVRDAKKVKIASADVAIDAMKALGPAIDRMKKMPGIFDGSDEKLSTNVLGDAQSAYDKLLMNLKKNFNDKATTANEALERADVSVSELSVLEKDLAKHITLLAKSKSEFKDEKTAMENALAKIKAHKQIAEAVKTGAKALRQEKKYEDDYPDETPAGAEPPSPSGAQARDKASLDTLIKSAQNQLRAGMDACKCADYTPVADLLGKAEDQCVRLGGCGNPKPCAPKPTQQELVKEEEEVSEDRRSWHERMYANLFGGSSRRQPAALVLAALSIWACYA